MKQGGIYVIITPTGRRYIGSAKHFARRWAVHRWNLRKGNHHSAGLQAAANKYGIDALHFEILEVVEPAQLLEREQFYIDSVGLQNLLNGAPTAGNQLGLRHTPETRAAYSVARKGRKIAGWTAERRERMQAVLDARGPASAETRAKMSEAKRGRKLPEHVVQERSERLANRSPRPNASGFPGVARYRDRWSARLNVGRKRLHIGYFKDPADAYAAICTKARDLRVPLPLIESSEPIVAVNRANDAHTPEPSA